MKILITGSNGFIGKNLVWELKNRGYGELHYADILTSSIDLKHYCRECNFVFHLAGINRPQNEMEFIEGNIDFTAELLGYLKENNNRASILCTSSIQALLDNPYGKSKLAGEELLIKHQLETQAQVLIYRLSNVFGKWCRPNYNSVVATFCYNLANGIPIRVDDPTTIMNLLYIDDVVNTLISAMEGKESAGKDGRYYVKPVYPITLGQLADTIKGFLRTRTDLVIPNMQDEMVKKLYSTYLSYLREDKFSYPLKMNVDNRGSFTEIFKTNEYGQVSVNISKPGITKGNHWHQTKNEKFLVVSGSGIIRFRKLGTDKVIEYHVSDKKLEVIDIPVGYTHNITNTGTADMVTIMWANEIFNSNQPDTYPEEV